MPEESPAPFIVFRSPRKTTEPYDRALELVGVVHEIVHTAGTRFYLKDRLDRAATRVVFELRRAADEPARSRWKRYRAARTSTSEVATVLDIFTHQHAAADDLLAKAQRIVIELLAQLTPLTQG
jgi:hypothetical protein